MWVDLAGHYKAGNNKKALIPQGFLLIYMRLFIIDKYMIVYIYAETRLFEI
jgi:hypothetical protein